MAEVTAELARRLEELPRELQAEFPHVPLDSIEHGVSVHLHELIDHAHFTEFIPLLVHKAVREDLLVEAAAER